MIKKIGEVDLITIKEEIKILPNYYKDQIMIQKSMDIESWSQEQ